MPDDRTVEFIQYHRPDLMSGDYTITFDHKVDLGFGDSESFSETKSFSVRGERFKIASEEIVSCFPPDGSFGDFSNCLPHIVISKSTLPWERTAGAESSGSPWLAILLVYSTEASQIKSETLPIGSLGCTLESGEDAKDNCQTLVVSKSFLESLVPSEKEMNLLVHVRSVETSDKVNPTETGTGEFAVVVGNRLGKAGSASVAYLVSLEGYYDPLMNSRYAADANGNVRIVSLKSWSFSSESEQFTFKHLVSNLNRSPSTLRLPDSPNLSGTALETIRAGYLPVAHHLRQGDKTVSWYRGPLISYPTSQAFSLPASASDELTVYDPANGVFNAAYSSAWELGRLLALQSLSFSMALYRWKLSQKRQDLLAKEKKLIGDLFGDPSIASSEVPLGTDWFSIVSDWLGKLGLLIGVPFSYLVPDERMLPQESVRFFELDPNWVDSLLDGAFSIGRSTSGDLAKDKKTRSTVRNSATDSSLKVRAMSSDPSPAPNAPSKITGVLIRSAAVSGWPNLEVRAYSTPQQDENHPATDQISTLRMDHLSKDVLLCLFLGEALQVDVQLPSEGVHFGLDFDETFSKELRDPEGDLEKNVILNDIPFRETVGLLNVDLFSAAIAQKLNVPKEQFTSAQFALQMVEGVDKISFLKS
ncbi:hypothetical protein EHO61_08780 [Leptospira fluminis]|uniref:Uncharacterized protein n=1 Tax=Leptospira fluminis TaxID=2484979 RepID=A0A4R9GQ00_9LEPT|nr:hypothetical protein [Leptospira fluminis]TGK18987.1 hypothetical protein EHO61_08780 [Leptospira fluminis]